MGANKRSGRIAALVELVVCQLGLLFFGFLCFQFFGDPSQLLKGTGFEDLPKSWQMILGRVLLLAVIGEGVYFSIRSILNLSRALESRNQRDDSPS